MTIAEGREARLADRRALLPLAKTLLAKLSAQEMHTTAQRGAVACRCLADLDLDL